MLEKFLTEAGVTLLITILGFFILLAGRLLHVWAKTLSARVTKLEAEFQAMVIFKTETALLLKQMGDTLANHIKKEEEFQDFTKDEFKLLREGQTDILLELRTGASRKKEG